FDPDGTLARQAEAELAACGVGTARGPAAVIVSSFWPADLEAVLAGDPARATGLLVHPSLDPVAALDQAAGIGCVALHLFRAQVSAELVDRVHGRALSVAVWTVNEPADLAAASEAGVDVLITDRVAEARAVLAG
ncbi:MAG: glycerophosphodiester phosphodiesterase, partial [Acidimicrobiales bacterium]